MIPGGNRGSEDGKEEKPTGGFVHFQGNGVSVPPGPACLQKTGGRAAAPTLHGLRGPWRH